MPRPDPIHAREFAVAVVRQLRDAGFESLWAGGCVRDQLMGREPKDYDVATNATPTQIQEIFGRRRTLAIGAAFGVICVVGPRESGQIDVATFRRDATYSDGRHPDAVTFSTAEEDARRRDFTINGLFFDPLTDTVIDFVGGQEDLSRQVIRAIGEPAQRFAEDKLRMLRAVRFAATLSFDIEAATMAAIQRFATDLRLVSAERVAEELRRMFVHPARHHAFELLRTARLLPEIVPELARLLPTDEPTSPELAEAWDRTIRTLERLAQPTFAVALAVLLREVAQAGGEPPVKATCSALRLANDERDGAWACLAHEATLRNASTMYWPQLQRILIMPRIEELLTYAEAVAEVLDGNSRAIAFCREKLALPAQQLNPPPLLTGDDLRRLQIPVGPRYRKLLDETRDRQLLGELESRDAAIEWIRTQTARPSSS